MILAWWSIGLLLLPPIHAASPSTASPSAAFQFSSTGARLRLPTCPSVARLGDDGSDNDVASSSSSARLMLDPTLTNDRIEDLYAWIAMATQYHDGRYDEQGPHALLAAVFGELHDATNDENRPDEMDDVQAWLSYMRHLKEEAVRRYRAECQKEWEEVRIGPILTQQQREQNALGPLGAGQWSGQTDETYAHSLLRLTKSDDEHTSSAVDAVEEWTSHLPRKCRQTLRKAEQNAECTQRLLVIANDKPAPQSTLAHFRCVVEHQVRLSQVFHPEKDEGESGANQFVDAILEGIDRFLLSINGCGSILEFRHAHTDRLLGFCHLVGKGKVLRGQWFYASNAGSRQFLWFKAVHYAVERAAREEGVEVVDLGPNGTDGRLREHAELKERYGFGMVEDWPEVADYRGPFWTV